MSTQKKILVVAESIDVEDSSASKGRVALVKNLYKAGFEIQVYHYTKKDIHLENIPCVVIKENRRSFLFILSRIERFLRNKLNFNFNRPIEKIFGFSFTLFNDRNSIITALRNIEDFKPDLILTLSKGGSFRPHHALLKITEWHSKWLAYIHDPYPMYLYPRPYAYVEPGSIHKWKFVKEMSQKAAYPVFPSQLLKEWMGSYFHEYLLKGRVIPHQMSRISTVSGKTPEFFDPEKFNILHAGNLLHGRNPQGLINAFSLFLKNDESRRKNSRLHFVGQTEYHNEVLIDSAAKITEIIINSSNIEYSIVQVLQHNASVNVILEAKSEISPFLPGKFPHCVAANKPILLLGPYYSETRRLLGSDYPYWAEIDEEEKILSILENFYNKWKKNETGLNRKDLEYYLSSEYLKELIDDLNRKG